MFRGSKIKEAGVEVGEGAKLSQQQKFREKY
jgi:hypothetical protein